MMDTHTAAQMVDGRRLGVNAMFRRVTTDTRALQTGDLFVALAGERFDGHDYVAEALLNGASAAMVDEAHAGKLNGSLVAVADTRAALRALAAQWRMRFDIPLIIVTGSNGKTTVKEMTAAILRAQFGAQWGESGVLATRGNLNNDIGLPLTLLRLRATHKVGVVELGMNHPGEIASLAGIARPTVALVNNAQREHQEFMATVDAVARENGCVLAALGPTGVTVFPAGDEFTPVWKQIAGSRPSMTFGDGGTGADIVLAGTEWQDGHWQVRVETPCGPVGYCLHIAGRHNVRNSQAAVACALAAGVPLRAIAQGLEAFEPVKGRSRAIAIVVGGHPITLVDDTYNANPDSVRAAIDVLAELPGPRLAVLGDMGEVGTQGPQFHAEVGEHARQRGIDKLFTLGEQSAAMKGRHFGDVQSLNAAVRAELPAMASVLVKGSRFMKMERVVEAILQEGTAHAA